MQNAIFDLKTGSRRKLREQGAATLERVVIIVLVTALVLVERKVGFSYVLMIFIPLTVACGLAIRYYRRRKLRT